MKSTITAVCSVALAAALSCDAPALAADEALPSAAAAGEAPGDGDAGATPIAGEVLFKAFHGKAGVDRIVEDLLARVVVDPRIADIFKAQDLVRLKYELSDQLCYLLGGPCTYTGKDMRTAHKDLGLQQSDFNALVEDLQAAMDKEGVAFRDQNRLLAKLAPMERMVVVR